MAANTKPTLKYRVNTYKDIRTGAAKRRPVLVESETYGIERVVRYALDNAYMRGQYEDSKGNALCFLEAVKALAAAGLRAARESPPPAPRGRRGAGGCARPALPRRSPAGRRPPAGSPMRGHRPS